MSKTIFRKISQNRDYIQTHCNNRRNSFHFACCQWYSYVNKVYLHEFKYKYCYNYSYICMNTFCNNIIIHILIFCMNTYFVII